MSEIAVKANVFPYRFSMRDKQPVELTVELKNNDSFEKMVSLDVMLPNAIGTDKSCLNKGFSKRYNKLGPGQTITEKQMLYLSPHANIGEATGKVRVSEHYNEFGNILSSFNKTLALRIVP